jgi:hypothetical protein
LPGIAPLGAFLIQARGIPENTHKPIFSIFSCIYGLLSTACQQLCPGRADRRVSSIFFEIISPAAMQFPHRPNRFESKRFCLISRAMGRLRNPIRGSQTLKNS